MASTSVRPQPTAPREYNFPKFHTYVLTNGLRLIVAPVTKLPLISVLAVVDAGAAVEPVDKHGIATLTARLLQEGAAELNGAQLADRFERIGASVETSADWDVAGVSVTAQSDRLEEALGLVRDMLRSPTFPEREVERLKQERLAELLQLRAEPRELADEQFSRAMFASSARYAYAEGGDEASVRRLTRDAVNQFFEERYQPPSTTLIFAGDVTLERAIALSEQLFGDWRGNIPAAAPLSIDTPEHGALLRIVTKSDAPQSEVRVGHRGLPRSTPDYFDVTVMNAVLGGLFSSRINMNLREEHGYTYGASSMFDWRRGAGPFVVSTAVKSDVTAAAVHEIIKEIERMRVEEIGTEELSLATSYLDGVFPIRYETTSAIAQALANMVIYELPEDYFNTYRSKVRAVTTAGVQRAAQTYLDANGLRIVVVGDPLAIAKSLEDVTHMKAETVAADS